MLNVPVPEIILNEPGIGSLVGRAKPQAWRSMCGWAEKGRAAALLQVSKIRLTVERFNGLRCSLTKNALQFGSIRARCFNHAPIAFSSSGRNGWVVDNPCFNLAVCKSLRVHLFEFQTASLRYAEAVVKQCNTAPGKPGSYFWACVCDARGFFPEEHFKELDRLKKISFASRV